MNSPNKTLPIFAVVLALGSFYALPARGQLDILVSVSNQKVSLFDSSGNLINLAYLSSLGGPRGLAVDSSGDLFVAQENTNKVTEYNASGSLINTITNGLSLPQGLALDASGNLWVSSGNSNKVTEYNSSGTLLQTVSGITGFSSSAIWDVAVGPDGNIYAASSFQVAQISPSGSILHQAYVSGFSGAHGLAFDSSGDLFVTDVSANVVKEFNSSGSLINTITSGLSSPWGMAIDASGDLYVVNHGNEDVSQYDSNGNLLNSTFISGLGSGSGAPDSSFMVFDTPAGVPEPSAAGLLASGAFGLAVRRRR